MSEVTLTKTRFREGVWEGILTCSNPSDAAPEIAVTLRDRPISGVTVKDTGTPGRFGVEIQIPTEAVGDGVQTFLITEMNSGDVLDSFTIMAGEVVHDDFRAEVELLRAELDMLKRAFRRHCVETM